jgi:6-phosphogluconolactonase/glucosamine-6-phosphate isomerase/deaminase
MIWLDGCLRENGRTAEVPAAANRKLSLLGIGKQGHSAMNQDDTSNSLPIGCRTAPW